MKRVVFMGGYDADERLAIVEQLFAEGAHSCADRAKNWWAEKEVLFFDDKNKELTYSDEDYGREKITCNPGAYVEVAVKLERSIKASIVALPPAQITHEGYYYTRSSMAPCTGS